MNKGVILGKSAVCVAVWIIFYFLRTAFYPVLTNDQALKQLNDTTASFTSYAGYQQFWNFAWIIPVVLCIVFFSKELKLIFYKIKGGF